MKPIFASAFLLLTSVSSFAGTIVCSTGVDRGPEHTMTVSLAADKFYVSNYETEAIVKAGEFSSITGRSFEGQVDSILAIVDQKIVDVYTEGEHSTSVVSAVFAYNPQQRAARATVIWDGRTMMRNELLTNCETR